MEKHKGTEAGRKWKVKRMYNGEKTMSKGERTGGEHSNGKMKRAETGLNTRGQERKRGSRR